MISEYEPIEAFALLTDDDLDLALTYDYNLAPASPSPVLETVPLWSVHVGPRRPRRHPGRAGRHRRVRRPDVDRQLPQHR